jgi:CheY-like chemotaxis protein
MKESQRPVLTIGVVAEILGISVQTLRLWENKGLVSPSRKGKDRYYSEEDLKRLKYIKYLLHEKKLNTYGVREILLKEGWEIGAAPKEKLEATEEPFAVPQQASRQKTILIVDDDPDFVNVLKTVLEANGYIVITTMSGRDALFKLETEKIDMVILDIMIPDVDGIEICKTIKSNHETASMPVLIISNIPENLWAKFGVNQIPADTIAQKPIRPSELVTEIRKFLP